MNARFLRFVRAFLASVGLAVLMVSFGAAIFVLMGAFGDGARGVAARPFAPEAANVTADLSITKTNNLTQVVPGMQVVYTLTLANPTTETIANATLVDLSSPSYFPQRFSTAGVNAIAQTVTFTTGQPIQLFATFGPGGFLNVVVTGTLSADATGLLTNTAQLTAPAGVTDPNLGNNTATDADPIVMSSNPMADLQISKTDGLTQVTSAQALSYTVMVTNAGPMAVTGVQITDVLPSGYQAANASVRYSSATQRGLGLSFAGVLTATYDLLPGGTVVIVVNGSVKPTASLDLTNTATVTLPATVIDPDVTNNVAVDVDALIILPRTYLPLIRK